MSPPPVGAALVCIVDDDEAVRESLGFLLRSESYEVRTHASAENFLRAVPDDCACLITDVRMPGMDGIALMRALHGRGRAIPVIVMTGHGDVPLAVGAMKDGAADFLQKPFSDEAVLAALRAVLAGRAAPEARRADGEARERLAALSRRERQVLDGLVAGKANKVIAAELGISARTVEVYRANVMTKTRADSFADLVRIALRAGAAPQD